MNIEIANHLVQLRKQHGYSQEALAEKLGLSRQAVSKWERAEASPDTDNLIALAKLYGMSLDELLLVPRQAEDAAKEKASALPVEETTPLAKEGKKRQKSPWLELPFPILVGIVYIILGLRLNWWHPGWLLFLTIPLYYSLVEAILQRDAEKFAFPVLAATVYLWLGFCEDAWASGWWVFLLIPVYYLIASVGKKKETQTEKEE